MAANHYQNIVIGSGEGGKYLAWHLAKSGQPTVVVERRWIGGSCPNTNCLPAKNEIWSAKVAALTRRASEFGYASGIGKPDLIRPESYTLDAALIGRPGNADIQLDLFLDYANNVKLYPAFQEYFRKWKPPMLAIWGKHDPYFVPAGAEAFRRDNPNATVQFLDTGHFALETHVDEIALAMRAFLETVLSKPGTARPAVV
jgi:pimeloyl-ACP methyl ester carboxylesterase